MISFSRAFLFFSALLMVSCQPNCRYQYCTEGAQEFVLDSYRIREGKFSILEMEGKEVCCLPCSFLEEYEDKIDEDDTLKIAIYHPTRADLTEAVNAIGTSVGYRVVNGKIHLPGLEPMIVKGYTLDQARKILQDRYDGELKNTEIFIDYFLRQHAKVTLIGEVELPQIAVNGRIRLFEVLSAAGIPPLANLFKSYVVRDGYFVPVDMYRLVHEGDMSQNIVMRPNDKIFIADPLSATVSVMGEVGIAKVIPIPKGNISLREAIAAAGGIPYTGNKRCIQVIRGNITCPKIYHLSWNHITYLPNDSLLLMPGDTVYISENPITRWNRFIEQLLPSSLLIDLGIKTRGVFY